MKKLTILSLLVALFFSCEKDIDLDNKYAKQKLVVNALMQVGSEMKLSIYKSNLPLGTDEEFSPIKDALVILKDGNGLKSNFTYDGADKVILYGDTAYYTSSDTIKNYGEYDLTIETDDFKTTKSKLKVQKKPIVSNIKLIEEEEVSNLKFTIDDNPNEENYYHFEVFLLYYDLIIFNGDTIIDGPHLEVQYLESDNNQNNLIQLSGSENLITDILVNGKKFENSFNIYTYQDEFSSPIDPSQEIRIKKVEKIIINISTINKGYYNYLVSVNQQLQSQNDPFSEAGVISTNIENGIGVFGVKNSVVYEKSF